MTTPTISMSVVLSRPQPKCRPSGLSVPKKYFAIVSLMMATCGAPATSLTVNSRPLSSGCPIVAKNPGPTPLTFGFMSSPSFAL